MGGLLSKKRGMVKQEEVALQVPHTLAQENRIFKTNSPTFSFFFWVNLCNLELNLCL